MKPSPEDKRILERMAPGALSRDGFLGDDPRSPWDIIDDDTNTVEDLGYTNERVAARLKEILDKTNIAPGARVNINDHLHAVYYEAMGRIASPFGEGMVFPKGEVELTDTRQNKTLRFTPLSIHLIAAHGFYQGRGSRYRLDPKDLIPAIFEYE